MVPPNFAPAFRISHDLAQGTLELVQEGNTQAPLPLLIPDLASKSSCMEGDPPLRFS